jgi:alpha-1,2-mannosyltransferase
LSVGLVATIVVVGIAVALRVVATRSWPFWDLDVYIAGARALTGHADLYAVSAQGLLFTYPPFAAITFLPLAAAEGAAGGLLTVLSLMAFGVVGVVIARRLRLSTSTTLVVLAGALVLEPVTRTLVLGQINLVLMALVVADLFVVPRGGRGLLIGLAAGLKLTPAVFVIYFLVKRDYRAAGLSLAGFVVTVLLGWAIAPDASLTYWSGRALALNSFGDDQIQSANQSLRGALIRLLGTPDPPALLWVLLTLTVIALGVWVCRVRVTARDDVGAVLALAATSLVVSPISWTHHWVWVVVGILYAVSHRRFVAAWVLGLVFFVAPMWFLPAGGLVELGYASWQVAVSVTYLLAGLVGLLLLGRSRDGAAHGVPR